MPSGSVIAAVMSKFATLTAANFPASTVPPIFLDEAPQATSTAGVQQRLPYVIIRDSGFRDEWDMEQNSVTQGRFSLDAYANSLVDCDAIMKATLFNGLAPNVKSGIAFMTPDLTAPLYGMSSSVHPTTSQRSYAGVDYQQKRVYRVTQDFEVVNTLRGTG